jgi:hypothetical protein
MINILVITICAYTRIEESYLTTVSVVYTENTRRYVLVPLGECDRKEVTNKKINDSYNTIFYLFLYCMSIAFLHRVVSCVESTPTRLYTKKLYIDTYVYI